MERLLSWFKMATTVMITSVSFSLPWSKELQSTPRFEGEDRDGHTELCSRIAKYPRAMLIRRSKCDWYECGFWEGRRIFVASIFPLTGSITYCFFFGITFVFNQEKRDDEVTKISSNFCNNRSKRGKYERRIDTCKSLRWAVFIILFELNLNILFRQAEFASGSRSCV